MFRIFLLLLPLLLHAETGPPATWIKNVDYELSPATVKPSQINTQHLLMDTQRNWEESTLYKKVAIKPLTQTGVEQVSHLKMNYNPAFTRVCVHAIRVFRNGIWSDRLSTSRHHILQREDDLEIRRIYSGYLTLVYFISDIRVGDVVEYQYSYIGRNPLFTTYVDDVIYLEDRPSIEKISYRLLAHPSRDLKIKPYLTNQTFHVQDLSPDLREWSITTTETEARPDEPLQPPGWKPYARLQINEYHTWKRVIDQIRPLVTLPESFIEDPLPEILLLLREWVHHDPYERARLATRFVQNEIHYLSLSDGISAHKPEDPTICFTRRFGDCKDKTLLLHGLLKLLGIASTPVLVHSSEGASLPDSLPSPLPFNHMVLRIDFKDASIFVDPTLTLQGGPLTSNFFPRFFYGLPLSEEITDLIPLPETAIRHPTQIETTLELKNDNLLEVRIETRYYDQKAELMRRRLAFQGPKKLSENHLLHFQSLYREATPLKPVKMSDDPTQNIFTTREKYLIPLRLKKGKRRFDVQSELLHGYLQTRINPDRKTPYQLIRFPLWIQEHLRIKNLSPTDPITHEEMKFEHDSFTYYASFKQHLDEADFTFELKLLKDHVVPSHIPSFNEIMSEIESTTDMEVTFQKKMEVNTS